MTGRIDVTELADNEIMTRSVLPRVDATCPSRGVGVVTVWGLPRSPRAELSLAAARLHRLGLADGWDAIHITSAGADLHDWAIASEQWRQPYVSIFADERLVFSLRNRGLRAIYLGGGAVEHQVDVSARDGADLGFDVWIVAEAVEAELPRSEATHLERLATYSGVHVCSIADIPFTATTPEGTPSA